MTLTLSVLLFSSCSQRLVDFTVISSKNHNLNLDKSKGKQVEGKQMGFLGLGTSIKGAMDKALESAGPNYDLLIDGVVSAENYFFVGGYIVKGVAVDSNAMRLKLGEAGFKKWLNGTNIFEPETIEVVNVE